MSPLLIVSPVPTTVYPLIEAGEIGAMPGKDGERREDKSSMIAWRPLMKELVLSLTATAL